MEILTFNRWTAESWTAESFEGNRPYLVISITDPKQPEAKIPKNENIRGILRVQFDDIDKEINGYKQIDSYQADQIASFIKHGIRFVDFIVVHCEAGISRSAGVSMAITDWMIANDMEVREKEYPCANRLVYRMVYESLMRDE